MGITDSQKTAIKAWSALTGLIWIGYFIARLTVGGNCERPELMESFDKAKYLGVWYEMYRSKTVLFEEDDCATATYVELPNNYIEVNNLEFSIEEQINIGGSTNDPGKAQCSSF